MTEEYLLHTALALWSLILGAFLCALYDVFRLFRLRRRQNAFLLFICDLVFCLVAAVAILLLFFNLSYGRMRGYAFVIILIGFLMWRFTVSRLVMSLMMKLAVFIEKLINSIKMRISNLVKRLIRRIYTASYCRKTVSAVRHWKLRKESEK